MTTATERKERNQNREDTNANFEQFPNFSAEKSLKFSSWSSGSGMELHRSRKAGKLWRSKVSSQSLLLDWKARVGEGGHGEVKDPITK